MINFRWIFLVLLLLPMTGFAQGILYNLPSLYAPNIFGTAGFGSANGSKTTLNVWLWNYASGSLCANTSLNGNTNCAGAKFRAENFVATSGFTVDSTSADGARGNKLVTQNAGGATITNTLPLQAGVLATLSDPVFTSSLKLFWVQGVTNNCIQADVFGSLTGTGQPCGGSVSFPVTPVANHATCVKAVGPPVTLGYCSTAPDSSGVCTPCN